MPAFSEDQINEAKERVRRMHARAGSYLPREEPPQGHNDRQTAPPPGKEKYKNEHHPFATCSQKKKKKLKKKTKKKKKKKKPKNPLFFENERWAARSTGRKNKQKTN